MAVLSIVVVVPLIHTTRWLFRQQSAGMPCVRASHVRYRQHTFPKLAFWWTDK
ncbi:MAG TPA: hypothetical protein VK157_01030 [Phycisphaerales bacterium]|nr:hypothetical protein [Phycisphaerales bacterium]